MTPISGRPVKTEMSTHYSRWIGGWLAGRDGSIWPLRGPVLTSPLTWLVINGQGAKTVINMDELLSTEKSWYTLTIPLAHHQSWHYRSHTHVFLLHWYTCAVQWESHVNRACGTNNSPRSEVTYWSDNVCVPRRSVSWRIVLGGMHFSSHWLFFFIMKGSKHVVRLWITLAHSSAPVRSHRGPAFFYLFCLCQRGTIHMGVLWCLYDQLWGKQMHWLWNVIYTSAAENSLCFLMGCPYLNHRK